jgi:hypothetical protein
MTLRVLVLIIVGLVVYGGLLWGVGWVKGRW